MRKYNLYFEANRSRFSFSFKNTWPADCQVHTHRLAPTWPLLQVLATFLCTTKYSTNSCRSSAGTLIIALLQRFSLWPLHLATQLCMQSWSWYSANFAFPLAHVTWYITSTTSSAGIIGLVFNVSTFNKYGYEVWLSLLVEQCFEPRRVRLLHNVTNETCVCTRRNCFEVQEGATMRWVWTARVSRNGKVCKRQVGGG